jgi:Tfp pilus assembly pilus retraction ATPase PilT
LSGVEVLGRGKFGGDLSAFSLFEVCQFLMIVRQTGTLVIRSEAKSATIAFSEGRIVSVVDDKLSEGEEAFYRIVTWEDGTFEYGPGPVAVPANSKIGISTDGLLLEAARMLDEGEIGPEGRSKEGDARSHTRAILENQQLATEFADLLTSLDTHSDESLDFQKDVPLEKILSVAQKRRASQIFLRVGEEPKARVGERVVSVGRVAVTQRALDRITRKYFNGQERQRDKDSGFQIGENYIDGHGYVMLECERFPEGDRVGITLLSSEAPLLDDFGVHADGILQILRESRGIFLVASPPRGGKSALAAALAMAAASKTQRHVAYYEESRRYHLKETGGLLESHDLPMSAAGARSIPEQVWRRKVDVIVLDAIRHQGHVESALDAASSGALVVAVVEAEEVVDAIAGFLFLVDDEKREDVASRLAHSIIGILAVAPRDPAGVADGDSIADLSPAPYKGLLVPRSEALVEAIQEGDPNAIRHVLEDPGAAA